MAKDELELPRMVYKPGGLYAKVETPEALERAQADGWELLPPKGWNDPPDLVETTETTETNKGPDPASPEPKQVEIPQTKDDGGAETSTARHASKTDGAHDIVLDGTVADVGEHVSKTDDIRHLQELRRQENKGAQRKGVLDAIAARIEEIKG